jgi:predicted esterase
MRRRRVVTGVSVLALTAIIAASCSAASGSGKGAGTNAAGTTAGSSSSTTTTTFPASFGVGLESFSWSEHGPHIFTVTPTGGETPGRKLTTQIRYPTLAGSGGADADDAKPASRYGPFPVIVFAHGFDTLPSTYAPLLDAWVRAGFVVVSPIFPDENATTMARDGGTTSNSVASDLESDERNEPRDIAFVLRQLIAVVDTGRHELLKGVLKISDVALAGQSDGGNVVAALAFSSAYASTYASLPVAPKAVAVFSGEWQLGGVATVSAKSPPLLQIQSDADGCVSPKVALDMYSSLEAPGAHHFFVTLLGADHLGPFEGQAPYASVVEAVTTDFFKLELDWHSAGISAATLHTAGTVTKVSSVTTTVDAGTLPAASRNGGC